MADKEKLDVLTEAHKTGVDRGLEEKGPSNPLLDFRSDEEKEAEAEGIKDGTVILKTQEAEKKKDSEAEEE